MMVITNMLAEDALLLASTQKRADSCSRNASCEYFLHSPVGMQTTDSVLLLYYIQDLMRHGRRRLSDGVQVAPAGPGEDSTSKFHMEVNARSTTIQILGFP